MRAARFRKVLQRIGLWMAELLVVFVGVYSAFLLDEYRSNRQAQQREQQIYTTLYQVFSSLDQEMAASSKHLDSVYVNPFFTAYRGGERPLPRVLPFGAGGLNEGTWEAMLQTGGLDVLDAGFIHAVEEYYGGLRYTIGEMERFNTLTDIHLIPNLDRGPAEFYEPESTELRQKYQWYPALLRTISGALHRLNTESDSLLARIEVRQRPGAAGAASPSFPQRR